MRIQDFQNRPTIEDLNELFSTERDRFFARMDDVAEVNAACAGVDMAREHVVDIENGYAFRLLEVFGTGVHLDLTDNCPGREYLLERGVDPLHLKGIAFALRLHERSYNVLSNPTLGTDWLRSNGIEANVANRSRSVRQELRSKADVLLDKTRRHPAATNAQVDRYLASRCSAANSTEVPDRFPTPDCARDLHDTSWAPSLLEVEDHRQE